mmetsp:Transcript_54323/g.129116  ORF Transcript_54323/g.129116 Transcript_54323/m.129116 type:complete len:205 (+) Transcript_54323:1180-1794(+)
MTPRAAMPTTMSASPNSTGCVSDHQYHPGRTDPRTETARRARRVLIKPAPASTLPTIPRFGHMSSSGTRSHPTSACPTIPGASTAPPHTASTNGNPAQPRATATRVMGSATPSTASSTAGAGTSARTSRLACNARSKVTMKSPICPMRRRASVCGMMSSMAGPSTNPLTISAAKVGPVEMMCVARPHACAIPSSAASLSSGNVS